MIDYHNDRVALREFVELLSKTSFADATTKQAQARALTAADTEPRHALLGGFVYHLIRHAASDSMEIALLQRAADLWAQAASLCAKLATARADLEAVLDNPGDLDAPDRFNNAALRLQEFANAGVAMSADIDSLRADVLKFGHLPRHPRQDDLETSEWNWGDLILGRRTEAFVRNLFRHASDDATLAFALGASSSYGASVAGSAYLGKVVGGPRRSHRQRDRLARNAVGAWFATHHPAAAAPATMADEITFGPAGNPQLPGEIESLLHDALAKTFDLSRTQPLPDLQQGYVRLLAHLRLLDAFVLPPVPVVPAPRWLAALLGDPQAPPPSLVPQDVEIGGQDGGGVAVGMGPPEPGSSKPDGSDSSSVAKGCGIALLLIIAIDIVQAFVQCIGQWSKKHTCTLWDNMLLSKLWEQDPPDPTDSNTPTDPEVTAAQLTAISSAPEAVSLVGQLFDLHAHTWEAMDKAFVFLAATGLIYPGRLATAPLYSQFTSFPAAGPWPHREQKQAPYHLHPNSPVENPAAAQFQLPPGAHPVVSGGAPRSMALWRKVVTGVQDSENLDLDGDRGANHPCWAARGSVGDDPIDVVILHFEDQ